MKKVLTTILISIITVVLLNTISLAITGDSITTLLADKLISIISDITSTNPALSTVITEEENSLKVFLDGYLLNIKSQLESYNSDKIKQRDLNVKNQFDAIKQDLIQRQNDLLTEGKLKIDEKYNQANENNDINIAIESTLNLKLKVN